VDQNRPLSALAAPAVRALTAEETIQPSSIDKAFRILAMFSTANPRLSLSEIQRSSGLAMTTTHRTVRNLVDLGALQICEDGRYAVGLTLWRLGCLSPATVDIERVTHPYMQALYDKVKQPVQLLVRDGERSVFVARCAATGPERNPHVGAGYTMHAGAGGQVLLAFAPRVVQERVLRSNLQAYTPRTPTDPSELRGILEDVRTQGYAWSDRQLRDDLLSVAAPIRDANDRVVGALSLVLPIEQEARHPWPRIVLATTRAISGLLARSGGNLPHTA
jgi:DNA-binding IclR family transcriptional regulator